MNPKTQHAIPNSSTRRFYTLFALLAIGSLAHADTTTNRLGLTLPTVGSPTWGAKINGNFQILDSTTNWACLGPNCSGGGGSGGGAGVIAGTGSLYQTPYVSVPSSNTLQMSSDVMQFPSSVTIMGATPILSTSTLQSGATFYVSSGTVKNFLNVGELNLSCPYDPSWGQDIGIVAFSTSNITQANYFGNTNGNIELLTAGAGGDFLSGASDGDSALYTSAGLWFVGSSIHFNSGNVSFGSGLSNNKFVKVNGSGYLTSYDLLNATTTWTGQQSWTSAQPSTFTALAVSGLASGQCVQTTTGGLLSVTGSACGAGGSGGASTLAVTTGTASGFNTVISSPTGVFLANGSQFGVALQGSATAYVTLLSSQTFSSMTITGPFSATNVASSSFTSVSSMELSSATFTVDGTGAGIVVTGPSGVAVTYGVSAGSMTGSGLTSCSGGSNALTWNSGTSLFGCNTISGGGGSSTLAVQQNAVNISSPTVAINFLAPPFLVSLVNGSTSQVKLDGSSVTLQGLVTAASLGALTANQSITVTGDSTGSGTTAIALTAAATQANIAVLSHALTVTSSATFTNVIQSTAIYVSSSTVGFDEYENGNSGTGINIDWTKSNEQRVTLTGSGAFTFTNPTHPQTCRLRILTGSGTFTWTWPAAVKWGTAGAPTITTTASKKDIVTCAYSAKDAEYDCVWVGAF